MNKELHEQNRLSWNAATVAHNSHRGDQAAFFRDNGNKLFPEERELLGDIAGLSVAHLQCNSGQDTLSLARLGAVVTGVDISDTAIDHARVLSAASGVPATFDRMAVYDWLERTARGDERFDVAFCSYGAIPWLSDLASWARGVAAILKPGGLFVAVEYHPAITMFDEQWNRTGSYVVEGRVMTSEEGIGDYVAFTNDQTAPWGYAEGVEELQSTSSSGPWATSSRRCWTPGSR